MRLHGYTYARARRFVQPGDVLLYRDGRSLVDVCIAKAGRSLWCHAGMVGEEAGELKLLEVVQWHGGRRWSLEDAIEQGPGVYDVFPVATSVWKDFSRARAVARMEQFVDLPYGWGNLLADAVRHLPIPAMLLPAPPEIKNEDSDRWPFNQPFCSQAVSAALRAGGLDAVPFLADRYTEPADLARSLAFGRPYTLLPTSAA